MIFKIDQNLIVEFWGEYKYRYNKVHFYKQGCVIHTLDRYEIKF